MLPWESTPQTWSPILTELIGIKNFLNNKTLSLRPCRLPLWQTQASWLPKNPCKIGPKYFQNGAKIVVWRVLEPSEPENLPELFFWVSKN